MIGKLPDLVFGKIPPYNKEAEMAVIGAIMLEPLAFEVVSGIISSECFYVDAHQRIYSAMVRLSKRGISPDLVTLAAELNSSGEIDQIGGAFFLATLTNGVVFSANIEAHALLIYQCFLSREIIRLGGEMISKAYDPSTDPLKLTDDVHTQFEQVRDKLYSGKEVSFEREVSNTIIHSLKARDNEGMDLIGVDTGSKKLNRLTGGWQSPDLIIIAARPGCGKTTLALDFAERMASNGHPVGFISLEMSTRQLITKLLAKRSRLSAMQIMRGNYNEEQAKRLQEADKLGKIPLFINDSISEISQLRSWMYKMVRKHKLKAVFLDYLQLAGAYAPGRSREKEIAEISKQLKRMAKALDIPIFVLSQLSREAERKSKPTLATLRESGAIEQDADQVIFIYDDPEAEYTPHMEDSGYPKPVHVEWAKYRLGTPGAVKATFHMRNSYFDFDGDGQEDLPF